MTTHLEAITRAADRLAEAMLAVCNSEPGDSSVSHDGFVSSSCGPLHIDALRAMVREYHNARDYPRHCPPAPDPMQRRPVVSRWLREEDMRRDLEAEDQVSDVEEAMVERSLPERDA